MEGVNLRIQNPYGDPIDESIGPDKHSSKALFAHRREHRESGRFCPASPEPSFSSTPLSVTYGWPLSKAVGNTPFTVTRES